jgi:hypothetical protein
MRPKWVSSGNTVWHASQDKPVCLAKLGTAFAGKAANDRLAATHANMMAVPPRACACFVMDSFYALDAPCLGCRERFHQLGRVISIELRRIVSAIEIQIHLGNTVLIDYLFVLATLCADGVTHWWGFKMRRIGARIE